MMGYTLVQTPKPQPTAPHKRYRLVQPAPTPGTATPVSALDANPMFSLFRPVQMVNEEAKQARELTAGEVAADIAKSGAAGLARGGIALAGLPADLFNIGQYGASRLMGESDEVRASRGPDAFNIGPTSEKITRFVNDLTRPTAQPEAIGEQPAAPLEYVSRSIPGEVAERVGEYAPAVAAGPGSVTRKAVMTGAPAVAGVAAKNAAEGTPLEPYAEPIAAIAAGGLAAGRAGSLTKQIAKNAPSHEAVKRATNAMYDKLRSAGISYDPMGYQNMAISVMGKLKQGGFRKAQAPLTADALEAVGDQLKRGSPDFNDLESIRKTTSKILREKNATDTDKEAASILLDELDAFMGGGKLTTNGRITPQQAGPMMKEAREMARRNILAKQIEDMFVKAETYQSGYESGLRNQFSNYLRSNKAKGLTKEERQAFLEVAKGNVTNNLLGSFGRMGVDFSNLGNRATLLPGGTAGAGIAMGEPVTGAAIVAAATGAKYAARQMTNRAAKRSMETVLAGREAQKNAASALRAKQIDILLRRMIAAENARLTTPPITPDYANNPKRENR